MKTAARVLSWVYQPLLMPTYLFVVILAYNPSLLLPLRPVWSLVFLITGMTFGLPAINFAFFRMTGSVRNLTMPDRRDRIVPFIFISVLYVFLTLLFYFKMHMLSLVYLLAIMSAQVIVATVITFYFKISIHALAAAGLSGMILGMMIIARDARLAVPLAVSMLLCGAVMSARLQLNAHRPIETTYGAVVGFALGVAGMLLLF